MAKRQTTKKVTPPSNEPRARWVDPKTGQLYAAARIRHPTDPELYYRQDDAINPWVKQGYSRWSIASWMALFASQGNTDLRNWEFFGEVIEIWPHGEGGANNK